MNLNGLNPDQIRHVLGLSKKIVLLEAELVRLQRRLVKTDATLTKKLVKSSAVYFHLN